MADLLVRATARRPVRNALSPADHDALHWAILANPEDEAPRLAYADLLEQEGHSVLAGIVRRPIDDEISTDRDRWDRWSFIGQHPSGATLRVGYTRPPGLYGDRHAVPFVSVGYGLSPRDMAALSHLPDLATRCSHDEALHLLSEMSNGSGQYGLAGSTQHGYVKDELRRQLAHRRPDRLDRTRSTGVSSVCPHKPMRDRVKQAIKLAMTPEEIEAAAEAKRLHDWNAANAGVREAQKRRERQEKIAAAQAAMPPLQLPPLPHAAEPGGPPPTISVGQRLGSVPLAGNQSAWQETSRLADTPPALWIMPSKEHFHQFLATTDQRHLAGLEAAPAGKRVIVRAVGKQSPPVLVQPGIQAMVPMRGMPGLYLPPGRKLLPNMRRSAVERTLRHGPGQVTWLTPTEGTGFQPETVPESAFRPVSELAEYKAPPAAAPQQTWQQSSRFGFDPFVEQTEAPMAPARRPRKPKGAPQEAAPVAPPPVPTSIPVKMPKKRTPRARISKAIKTVAVSEAVRAKQQLEDQFRNQAGPLDSPERTTLWPQLARASAAAGYTADAGVAWANQLWNEPHPNPAEAAEWLRAEDPKGGMTARDFDADMVKQNPSPADARAFAARVVAAYSGRLTPDLIAKKPAIEQHLQRMEPLMGIRPMWLAWRQLAGSDVLGLARARDRVLARLHGTGLSREFDMPSFLWQGGGQGSQHISMVRQRLPGIHAGLVKWHDAPDTRRNAPYVDYTHAFYQARMGDQGAARASMGQARAKLNSDPVAAADPVHQWLADAYEYRINEALGGRPHAGPLPAPMMQRLDELHAGRGKNGIPSMGRYLPDRAREFLRILEPDQQGRSADIFNAAGNAFDRRLAHLQFIADPAAKRAEAESLLSQAKSGQRIYALRAALAVAPTLGEDFAVRTAAQVPAEVGKAGTDSGSDAKYAREAEASSIMLALGVAGHYDRPDLVRQLFQTFSTMADGLAPSDRNTLLAAVAAPAIRGLRKLNMRDQISQFLTRTTQQVTGGQDLATVRQQTGDGWTDAIGALLGVAEGWQYFGQAEKARPILDAARDTLFNRRPGDRPWVWERLAILAKRYLSAAAHAPDSIDRVEEVFSKLPKMVNTGSQAADYFARLHLMIQEAALEALVGSGKGSDPQTQRWLDEDEQLVRSKVHRDTREAVAGAGL